VNNSTLEQIYGSSPTINVDGSHLVTGTTLTIIYM